MGQLGHTDPAFSLRVYGHAMHQGEGDKAALRALVEGSHWAPMGHKSRTGTRDRVTCSSRAPEIKVTPPERGFHEVGRAGLELALGGHAGCSGAI